MAEVNQIICNNKGNNTGVPKCLMQPDIIAALLAVPKGTVISASSLAPASIDATITGMLTADNAAARSYLIKTIYTGEDTGEAAQTEDGGYAGKQRTFIGTVGHSFRLWKGKRCMYQNLLSFDQKQDSFDFFLIDRKGQMMGTNVYSTTDSTIVTGLSGYSVSDITIPTATLAQVNASPMYKINLNYDNPTQFREDFGYVANFPALTSVNGLESLRIEATDQTGGVYNVNVYEPCTNSDGSALFGADLADTTAWLFYEAATGLPIATDTVTYVAGVGDTFGYYVVSADTGDANYPTPPAKVLIKLAAPSVLDGLNCPGIEGINTISIATSA